MKLTQSLSSLDRLHRSEKLVVVPATVTAEMHSSMTVWAQGNDESRVVGPTVADTPEMVRFQIRRTIGALEGGRFAATFATAPCSSQDIIFNILRALINIPRRSARFDVSFNHGKRAAAQQIQIDFTAWCFGVLAGLCQLFDWPENENERVTLFPIAVRRSLNLIRVEDKLAAEAQCLVFFSREQQNWPAGLRLSGNSTVALGHLHGAELAFAEVLKRSVVAPPVVVTMLQSGGASDNEDWPFGSIRLIGGDDPTPRRPPVHGVDVSNPVVRLPNFKAVAHVTSLLVVACDIRSTDPDSPCQRAAA